MKYNNSDIFSHKKSIWIRFSTNPCLFVLCFPTSIPQKQPPSFTTTEIFSDLSCLRMMVICEEAQISFLHQPQSDPCRVPGQTPSNWIRALINSAASTKTNLCKGIQINLRCHQQLSLISITFKQFIFMCILISVIKRQQMLSCMVIAVIPRVRRNCASRFDLVSLISIQ